ncbi:uncharacterized protein SPPG_01528 [Spizellomyces punctatus DAOM BR117]|uniref:NIPSNAP domain-containing protein n=1 Tax=Spizellomyces punctatus (strain DAOM BR117) TaxID=645134 RepID=A0A0L0HRV8_SPIPD|nr:uncharacterized protein SPPG_01528 [Spizellomyces punctatus DAOM BR117]KND04086.1 hypothetical protein SPPG_01528 [Spizellomyces punctatus DAOM BR117]|eukprot:XP_016612125.1 hypothetical protein SPPG_01528 [Spizellomyces punctatus DAOM BR117]
MRVVGHLSRRLPKQIVQLHGQTRCFSRSSFQGLSASSTPSDTTPEKPEPSHPSTKTSKAKAIVSSILHGSEKAKRDEADDNQTYSKILARGKYVHELQIHNVKPEAMQDYIQLLDENYPRVADMPEFKVKLFGSWTTEFGELDRAVHIWEYNNYPGYIETQALLKKDVRYQAFLRQLAPMLRSRQNQMLLEFAFWQGSSPEIHDGIYELRSYLLKPGRLLEWETEWRRGLDARRRFVQPVGAWFSQLGPLNWVHHMWAYPDLQVRKEMREKAWQVDGWAQTVARTVPLIETMESTIMKPMPFSPLK